MAEPSLPRIEVYRRRGLLRRRAQYGWRYRGLNGRIQAVGGEGFYNTGDVVDSAVTVVTAGRVPIKFMDA